MSVITKGKTFANGEQLTAGKLNQMLDAATFSSAAVDNTKTTLSSGAITIAPNGVGFSELSNSLVNDTDTMTDASATTLATSESIKAYIDAEILASRPKVVTPTGGTDQGTTGGSAGTGTVALNREITSGSTDTTFTYNMADFTSSDSDFHYKKIIAVLVRCTVGSNEQRNAIGVVSPDFGERFVISLDANDTDSAEVKKINVGSLANIPVNFGDSTFVLKHFRNDAEGKTVTDIVGFVIQPSLPTT